MTPRISALAIFPGLVAFNPVCSQQVASEWHLSAVKWRVGSSSMENMNYSSAKHLAGDRSITKNSKLSW